MTKKYAKQILIDHTAEITFKMLSLKSNPMTAIIYEKIGFGY
jgi:hypothetical protein